VAELGGVLEDDDGALAAAEDDARPLGGELLEPDGVAVVRGHPVQVGDVERHRPHRGVRRELVGCHDN